MNPQVLRVLPASMVWLAAVYAAAASAAPAPGRYEALLCVSTSAAPPSCGPAAAELRAGGKLRLRVSDIVYRLRLKRSQVDVVILHGAMQIDEFTADYTWAGTSLAFDDADKHARYELRLLGREHPAK